MSAARFTLGSLLARGSPVAALRLLPEAGAIAADGPWWPLAASARAAGIDGLEGSLPALFDRWQAAFPRLKRLARAIAAGEMKRSIAVPAARARLDTPLRHPRKLVCVGANYADHLAEMGASSIRKVPGVAPFFFLKPPTTVISGPGEALRIPRGCSNLDWEAEVVVVFGKGGRDIAPEKALGHIAGYTLGIDFTARDLFHQPDSFFQFNFTLGKCADGLTPVGPAIVPAAFADGGDLPFALSVNGATKQSSSTRHMVYTLAEQIAGVSRSVRIEAGDLMFTGSPAGVGLPRGERLHPGDRVRIESDKIGAMEVLIQTAG
jgi:2-keto-4-pentenoate hydratase/2-oxohepta-3-ene-1,7-dioic acid hydratase in catechol pathway